MYIIDILKSLTKKIVSLFIIDEEIITLKKIISIDSKKIAAVDTHGNDILIDVSECKKNFYLEFMGPDYSILKEDNIIGERNGMADPRYIIFYSEPPYYIELDYEDYTKIIDMIESCGLQTFDIT